MRLRILILAATASVTPTAVSGQAQFEGTVKGTMAGGGVEAEMVQHMRGSMMRLDMSLPDGEGRMSTITDVETGKTVWLLHDEKMWMDMAAMGQFVPGFSNKASSEQEVEVPEFRRTERVENIAGYECRHYILVLDDTEVDVCAAPELGCFIPGAPAGLDRSGKSEMIPDLPQSAELWLAEFPDGFFILSMTTDDGEASYIALELSPDAPPEELFTPPADYQEMKMPGG